MDDLKNVVVRIPEWKRTLLNAFAIKNDISVQKIIEAYIDEIIEKDSYIIELKDRLFNDKNFNK
jgi:hypothetical protein